MVRGIRGAITVPIDTPAAIHQATQELLEQILVQNQIRDFSELAAIIFTLTPDLTSAFPAEAARALGMHQVPLISSPEIPVPGSLAQVLRVLVLWNTELKPEQIRHVYLREAKVLRPDLNSAQ